MNFDRSKFREDLQALLIEPDIDLLLELYEARRCEAPITEVAKRLSVSPAMIIVRLSRVIDHLKRVAWYAVFFATLVPEDPTATPKVN